MVLANKRENIFLKLYYNTMVTVTVTTIGYTILWLKQCSE